MYQSFETSIKPGQSFVYIRLVFILQLLTAALILHVPIAWLIQGILLFILITLYIIHFNKNPCAEILELQLVANQKILLIQQDSSNYYDTLSILIHNEFFMLIQMSSATAKKRFVLFNDQLSLDQLRLLHIRARL